MRPIFIFLYVLLAVIIILTITLVIIYRDRIFYFKPKRKLVIDTFKDFLERKNATVRPSPIGKIDVIDIPAIVNQEQAEQEQAEQEQVEQEQVEQEQVEQEQVEQEQVEQVNQSTQETLSSQQCCPTCKQVLPINTSKSINTSKKVIVYLHGNYGNITMRERVLTFLSDKFKCRVVAVDYLRTKAVSVKNLVKIAKSVITELINSGVDIDDIIIWGESIGCAIALEVISVTGITNFIMQSGFRRIRDVVGHVLPKNLNGILSPLITELDNEKHLETLKHLNCVVLHSLHDELILYKEVKEMIDKLQLEHYIIGGTHSRPYINSTVVSQIKNKFKI